MKPAIAAAVALAALIGASSVRAEISEVKIARQFGISFLPIMVMQDRGLFEKHAKTEGLTSHAEYVQISGGTSQNDALLSKSIQVAGGGIAPFTILWARTKGTQNEVKAIAAKNCAPTILITRDPRIKSIRDFTDKDKIAMPATKISGTAITLQMATQKLFGKGSEFKYDNLQVAMSTPDGMQALLSGGGEVNNQFSEPPFQYVELKKPGIRAILNSYDVLGGKTTYNVIWTTAAFHDENPKTYKALLDAFTEAMQIINNDKRAAAATYLKISKDKSMSVDDVQAMIEDPQFEFTTTPHNMMKIVDFMYEVGHIKVKPTSWKDMFFPEVWNLPGT